MKDSYLQLLQVDNKTTEAYYLKSLEKTEQQKFLEKLLDADLLARELSKNEPYTIADICCGAGTCTYHLSNYFANAAFDCVDYNADAIQLAKNILLPPPSTQTVHNVKYRFYVEDATQLSLETNKYDFVMCMMSLAWISKSSVPLLINEIVRILKPRGTAYLSSLFNLDCDVDLYTQFVDHTRQSAKIGIMGEYNTYSRQTIEAMVKDKVSAWEIVPFHPEIDFSYDGRGIGSYTKQTTDGTRLQISAGMLLNWGFLSITK